MTSVACYLGVMTMVFMWMLLSLTIPFIGGALGDLIFRAAIGKSLQHNAFTYILSTLPIFGPLISTFIIMLT